MDRGSGCASPHLGRQTLTHLLPTDVPSRLPQRGTLWPSLSNLSSARLSLRHPHHTANVPVSQLSIPDDESAKPATCGGRDHRAFQSTRPQDTSFPGGAGHGPGDHQAAQADAAKPLAVCSVSLGFCPMPAECTRGPGSHASLFPKHHISSQGHCI